MEKKNIAIIVGVLLLGILLSELWLSSSNQTPKQNEVTQKSATQQDKDPKSQKNTKKRKDASARKKNQNISNQEVELEQSDKLPKGFGLTAWKRKEVVDVQAEFGGFVELTHRNDCLRVMPFKHPISQGNLNEDIPSPLILLENGQPLTVQNISKEECTGSVTYRDYQLLLNPSQAEIKDTAYSFALNDQMPIKTEKGHTYWLYKDTIQVTQLLTTKIGTAKTLDLRIRAQYIGAKTRDPVAIIGGERHVLSSTTENNMEMITTIPNEEGKIRIRLRAFNFMILDAIDVNIDGEWVALLL